MKRIALLMFTGLLLFGSLRPALATEEEAKALVEKAEAYLLANGKEKALQAFNDPKGEFVKGELYVFAWDMNGVSIAHINPKQLGINLSEVPDVDGKLFRKEGLEMAKKKGSGWIEYKLKNPQSGKVEHKTSYIKKVGDIVLGCGTYKTK